MPCIIDLPYHYDLATHYAAFASLPGFSLLESHNHQHGRYDILTAMPYDALSITTPLEGDAVYALIKEKTGLHESFTDLPFQGGAIGYFSYEWGALQANVPLSTTPVSTTTPFVELYWYDWAIIVDHHQQRAYLINVQTRPETEALVKEALTRWHHPNISRLPFQLTTPLTPILPIKDYHSAFDSIQSALHKGRVYQANLTQPFLGQYTGASWSAFQHIRQKNPVPFSAFLKRPLGDILCFSPERFLEIDNGHVLTSPIKGTIKRHNDPIEDRALQEQLRTCLKNRAEHVMIVDLMRNDLGQLALPGSVNVPTLFEIQSFPRIHHMVSHITANISSQTHPLDVFAACFPGGSITGAPKREAMHLIHECEPYRRGVYCGSIGYFSRHGRIDTNIAIRTLIAAKGQLSAQTGGAIVIDSDWKTEYQECEIKLSAIRDALEHPFI